MYTFCIDLILLLSCLYHHHVHTMSEAPLAIIGFHSCLSFEALIKLLLLMLFLVAQLLKLCMYVDCCLPLLSNPKNSFIPHLMFNYSFSPYTLSEFYLCFSYGGENNFSLPCAGQYLRIRSPLFLCYSQYSSKETHSLLHPVFC